jgi:hypothetical protein
MLYIMTANGWQLWLPTCVPCSNSNDLQGVYRGERLAVVQSKLQPRIDAFCRALGNFHPVNHAHEFRGDHYIEPLFGAYGEKL